MGNCCKTASSSTEWGGEDWSFLTSTSNKCNNKKKKNSINIINTNNKRKKRSSRKVFDELKLNKDQIKLHQGIKFNNHDVITSSSDDNHTGKIKIRMTKREFEAFMEEIEEKQKKQQLGKVISAEQVLVRLMKASRDNTINHHHHHSLREWSPVLETIPEISPDY